MRAADGDMKADVRGPRFLGAFRRRFVLSLGNRLAASLLARGNACGVAIVFGSDREIYAAPFRAFFGGFHASRR